MTQAWSLDGQHRRPEAVTPARTRCGPVASSRRRGGERKGAPATQPDVCPALPDLYHAQYRSLFRLAVLLTGDAYAAEAVVLDSFAALYRLRKRPQTEDDALPHLRRLLVAGQGRPGITISGTAAGVPRPAAFAGQPGPAASAADPLSLPGHQPVPAPDLG